MDKLGALFQGYADAVKNEDVKGQEAASLEILQYFAETQDEEPCPWLEAMGQAHDCEAKFDWKGAEAAYQCAIQSASESHGQQSIAYERLSAFYQLLDSEAAALEAAQAATNAARREKISLLLWQRLQAEAGIYLGAKDFTRAWTALNEAFALIEEGPMHNLVRARALVLRADCYTQEDILSEAEADLASSWKLLQPHAETMFAAGWQSGLANWWATTARLRTRQNDFLAAVAAWHEAAARRRIISQLPQLEGPYHHNSLAVALRDLGRSLRQVEDESAAGAFEESRSIRRAIGLPPLEE